MPKADFAAKPSAFSPEGCSVGEGIFKPPNGLFVGFCEKMPGVPLSPPKILRLLKEDEASKEGPLGLAGEICMESAADTFCPNITGPEVVEAG